MDALWDQITAEAKDQIGEELVVTRAILVFETSHLNGMKRLNRLSLDAGGKALHPWEAAGMLSSTLADILDNQGDPDAA